MLFLKSTKNKGEINMGKGSGWRKGTNFKKYQESDYWKILEEKKIKAKNTENKNK
jgi:hypothetical protein